MGEIQSKINVDFIEQEITTYINNYLQINPKIEKVINYTKRLNETNDKLEKYKLYKNFLTEMKKDDCMNLVIIDEFIEKCNMLMISLLV